MQKQINTTQIKEQNRHTEIQINEEDIGKLPEKEFRIMIAMMIQNPQKIEWRKCKNQLTHLNKTNKK